MLIQLPEVGNDLVDVWDVGALIFGRYETCEC